MTRGLAVTGTGANAGEDTSVAGLLLTTEVMVAEAPKDDEHKRPTPDMGGMGDMGM